jgi:hypothetical protein
MLDNAGGTQPAPEVRRRYEATLCLNSNGWAFCGEVEPDSPDQHQLRYHLARLR